MIRKSKKVLEAEKYIDEYILKFGNPPTYEKLAEHLGVAQNTAWYRCRKIRDKMSKINQPIRQGRYDLLEARILELENKIEQLMPTLK